LEEIGIPELTSEQVEGLCEIAEKAARRHVLSKVPSNRISTLDITIDTEGTKPVTVNVDIGVTLSPLVKNYDVKKLVNEAIEETFASIERYLRTLTCKPTK
jgi:hypothetical protein